MLEDVRAVIDADDVNLSNVLINKAPYSSLWPNSSMTTTADEQHQSMKQKYKNNVYGNIKELMRAKNLLRKIRRV